MRRGNPMINKPPKILWDVDGTLLKQSDDYSEKSLDVRRINDKLMKIAGLYWRSKFENIIITDRPEEQRKRLLHLFPNPPFSRLFCRNFPVEPLASYLERYRKWKLSMISNFTDVYTVTFEDDDVLIKTLLSWGLTVIDAKRFWK